MRHSDVVSKVSARQQKQRTSTVDTRHQSSAPLQHLFVLNTTASHHRTPSSKNRSGPLRWSWQTTQRGTGHRQSWLTHSRKSLPGMGPTEPNNHNKRIPKLHGVTETAKLQQLQPQTRPPQNRHGTQDGNNAPALRSSRRRRGPSGTLCNWLSSAWQRRNQQHTAPGARRSLRRRSRADTPHTSSSPVDRRTNPFRREGSRLDRFRFEIALVHIFRTGHPSHGTQLNNPEKQTQCANAVMLKADKREIQAEAMP